MLLDWPGAEQIRQRNRLGSRALELEQAVASTSAELA